MNPRTVEPHPSPLVGSLGGLAGTILAIALIYSAPVLGVPVVDMLGTLGRVVTSAPDAALAIGAAALFVLGTFIVPFVIARLWSVLPGGAESLGGALLKGVIAGGALWVLGVVPFARGVAPALSLLAADLGYGLAVAIVIAMVHGIDPIGTLGWGGYRAAVTPDTTVRRP